MIWAPRVTVAAIAEREGRFLLVEEYTNDGIRLNQPAGHLEQGESLIQAVIRETQEETAWTFEPRALVGVYRWQAYAGGPTYLRFCFSGICTHHNPSRPLDTGIRCLHWLDRDAMQAALAKLRSPLVMRCVDDYLAGKRYPLDLLCDLSL